MGGRNLTATRVYQSAARILDLSHHKAAPAWFATIESIPPSEILTRPQPIQHRTSQKKNRTKKASKLFKPQQIAFPEDTLRSEFYSDHPWELARPKVVLEMDGKDGQRVNWSRLQQRGRQLDGESVIQRQLWLLQNVHGMTSAKAYDQARQEFYALRHEEDVERRIAKEEALATGAYFGKSMLEIGMDLEDQTYEKWKEWATQEVTIINQQRDAAYSNTDNDVQADTTGAPGESDGPGSGTMAAV